VRAGDESWGRILFVELVGAHSRNVLQVEFRLVALAGLAGAERDVERRQVSFERIDVGSDRNGATSASHTL
jgi:hypothetical protein